MPRPLRGGRDIGRAQICWYCFPQCAGSERTATEPPVHLWLTGDSCKRECMCVHVCVCVCVSERV